MARTQGLLRRPRQQRKLLPDSFESLVILDDLVKGIGKNQTELRKLIGRNNLAATLRPLGYKFVTFIEAMMLRKGAWQEDVAVPGSPALKFSLSLQSEASLDPSLFRLHEKYIGFRFRFTVEYYGESSDSLEKTGTARLCPNGKQYQDRLASFSEKIPLIAHGLHCARAKISGFWAVDCLTLVRIDRFLLDLRVA
jgi:hypothetical protein